MRSLVLCLGVGIFAGIMGAQGLTEYGAAVAGGATGAAAGKKVSDGITAVFSKVNQPAADTAKQTKPAAPKTAAPDAAPTAQSTPSGSTSAVAIPPKPPAAKTLRKRPTNVDANVAKSAAKNGEKDAYSLVPPPPPIQRVAIGRPVEISANLIAPAPPELVPAPVPVPPPPPITSEDLQKIIPGTHREDVLKLGAYASRISMVDDGHLTETFRYAAGVVRVSDGVVASVELR